MKWWKNLTFQNGEKWPPMAELVEIQVGDSIQECYLRFLSATEHEFSKFLSKIWQKSINGHEYSTMWVKIGKRKIQNKWNLTTLEKKRQMSQIRFRVIKQNSTGVGILSFVNLCTTIKSKYVSTISTLKAPSDFYSFDKLQVDIYWLLFFRLYFFLCWVWWKFYRHVKNTGVRVQNIAWIYRLIGTRAAVDFCDISIKLTQNFNKQKCVHGKYRMKTVKSDKIMLSEP